MKLTSSYIVYLNDSNKVQCAKCRVTGRFVKRAIAQLEYEKEYLFIAFSTLAMLVILFTVHFSNVMSKVILSLDEVLSHLSNGKTIVLFTHLNTYLFNSKMSSEKELTTLLNTGEVKKGRIV